VIGQVFYHVVDCDGRQRRIKRCNATQGSRSGKLSRQREQQSAKRQETGMAIAQRYGLVELEKRAVDAGLTLDEVIDALR